MPNPRSLPVENAFRNFQTALHDLTASVACHGTTSTHVHTYKIVPSGVSPELAGVRPSSFAPCHKKPRYLLSNGEIFGHETLFHWQLNLQRRKHHELIALSVSYPLRDQRANFNSLSANT